MPIIEKNRNYLQAITFPYLQCSLEIGDDGVLARSICARKGIEGEPKTDGIDALEISLSLADFPVKKFGPELPPDDKPIGTPAWLVIGPPNIAVGIPRQSPVGGLVGGSRWVGTHQLHPRPLLPAIGSAGKQSSRFYPVLEFAGEKRLGGI